MDVTPIDRLEGKGCRCEAGRREWGQGVDEYPIHASIYMYTHMVVPLYAEGIVCDLYTSSYLYLYIA